MMPNRIFDYLRLRHFEFKLKPASPNTTLKHRHIYRFAWSLATLGTLALAQTPKSQFIPFGSFIEGVRRTDSVALSARAGSPATDSAAVEEMRQSILKRYEGVKVSHSYVRDGMYFDCVPVDQQPAVRTYGLTSIAEPPPQEILKDSATAADRITETVSQLSEQSADEFGNAAACEARTVPMERVTMEKLTRFSSLREFHQKSLGEGKAWQKHGHLANPDVSGHKYSVVYQNVNDLGGNTNINVWSPYVDTSMNEVFSLSQAWYVGGYGNNLQTEEVGWVVYPQMFNDENAHLFIYSTSGGYQDGTGCWNNSCGDFVQVTNAVGLGYSLLPVSTVLGPQYAPSFRYYLWYGNWWVAYNGTWVGYYPGAKYQGGQNSYFAQTVEFGTETVGSWYWPPAGSGYPANWGFGWAGFHLNVYYQGLDFATHPASLSILDVSSCYSIDGPYTNGGNGWNTFFYDGGWGGTGCT